jgi:hypothetical protein
MCTYMYVAAKVRHLAVSYLSHSCRDDEGCDLTGWLGPRGLRKRGLCSALELPLNATHSVTSFAPQSKMFHSSNQSWSQSVLYSRARDSRVSPKFTHTSAYVSVRPHTSACVSIRQHTSAYVSIICPVIARQSPSSHTLTQ